MTLTIELTPEEARRVEQAQAKGFDVTALLRGVIAGLPPLSEETPSEPQSRAARVQAICGKYAHTGVTVETFHQERYADDAITERQLKGRQP